MPILLLLFIWFIAEIVTFIYMGGVLGIGETIVEIMATIIIGVWLIKSTVYSAMQQGMSAFTNRAMIIARVIGGILLVIPGFLTDILGILALLSFPFGAVLFILGLGRKPDLQGFMRNRMMGGAFGGANPFAGQNPFANQGANPFNNTNNEAKANPLESNPVFQEMVKKQQANNDKDKVIDGEVIKKKN